MNPCPAVDDATLLRDIAQQNQRALSQLYDRYARIIYGLAFKSLHSVEESEEVVLDVFAQIWRIAERYDAHKGRADTWIFTLARSRILDRLRKIKRSGASTTFSIDAAEIHPRSADVDLFGDAMMRERRSQVRIAMQTLSPEQRQVIDLAYFHGLSQSEISAQTGLPLGTVKSRIRLGLNKLQCALTPQQF
jgi:RNA polymerase sigma factor (sigma-70 family)